MTSNQRKPDWQKTKFRIVEFLSSPRNNTDRPRPASTNPPMSKTIDIHLSQLRFPSACVVCMSPATNAYELKKVFTHRRSSYTVKVNAPMCDFHFRSAAFKGAAENFVDRLGVILGALSGLFVTGLLLVYWQGTGEGSVVMNLCAGSLFGLGTFPIVWAIVSLVLAPLFAESASKEARRAVRFRRYWPKDQFVRLEFQDKQLADIVQNAYRTFPQKTVIQKLATPRF